MIVLDTTVLVYATGGDHPLREPARSLVDAIGDGQVEATTTVQVLQEFAYVRARRAGRGEATGLVNRFAQLLDPLVAVETAHLRLGLDIWQATDRLGSFDATLAAVAITEGFALVSADKAFADVPGLDHINCNTGGIGRLLASAAS